MPNISPGPRYELDLEVMLACSVASIGRSNWQVMSTSRRGSYSDVSTGSALMLMLPKMPSLDRRVCVRFMSRTENSLLCLNVMHSGSSPLRSLEGRFTITSPRLVWNVSTLLVRRLERRCTMVVIEPTRYCRAAIRGIFSTRLSLSAMLPGLIRLSARNSMYSGRK